MALSRKFTSVWHSVIRKMYNKTYLQTCRLAHLHTCYTLQARTKSCATRQRCVVAVHYDGYNPARSNFVLP
jgi:hypothetical protein